LPEQPNRSSQRRPYHDAAAIWVCVTVLVSALVMGHFHEVGNINNVETDFYGAYAPQAENILKGQAYTYQHNPPGYVLALAFLSYLTDDLFTAAKVISAFATALFGVVMYLGLKSLFGWKIALISMIMSMLALMPYAFIASTDTLGALLIFLPIFLLVGHTEKNYKFYLAAGILCGVAYCVRYNTVFVVIGLLFSILVINFDNQTIRRRLQNSVLFACSVIVTISPWLIYNWWINGGPFVSSAHFQIAAHFYHPAGDIFPMKNAFAFNSLVDVIRHDPLVFFAKYLKGIVIYNPANLVKSGLSFPAFLFVGAGFLLLVFNLSKRISVVLITFLLGYLLLGLVGFHFRYYFFLWPLLFVCVNYFLFQNHFFIGDRHMKILKMSAVACIVLSIVAGITRNSYQTIKHTFATEPKYLLELGDTIKKQSSPEDRIICFKSVYSYFTGLQKIFPMAQQPDEYLKENAEDYVVKAKQLGARYVVTSDHEASLWQSLKSLSDPNNVPSEMHLIYRHAPTNTLVYEIR